MQGFRGRLVVGAQDDLLDLVEKVNAVQPVSVLTGCPGLAAETRALGDVQFRQVGLVEGFVAVQGRHRRLGRADQAHLIARAEIRVIPPGREEARSIHNGLVDKHGHVHQGEALGHHPVDGQSQHGVMQHRPGALERVVSAAGQLDAARNVDDVQRLAERHVVFGLEVELARLAMAADFDVLRLVGADGDVLGRRLGGQQYQFLEARLERIDLSLDVFEAGLDLGHLCDGAGFVVAPELGDFLAGGLLGRSKLLELAAQVAQLAVDIQQGGDVEGDAFFLGGLDETLGVVSDLLNVDHGLL